MTRLCEKYGAVNLAQGFPDFDPPSVVTRAAARALREGYNQYSNPYGVVKLRQAIARKLRLYNHVDYDPDTDITITCGTSEAMIASLLALLDKGDEVVIFEPFYENYGPDTILSGAKCRYVKLQPPDFKIEEEAVKEAFTNKTKAIIINTPHNPTGRVFTRQELGIIRDLSLDNDSYVVTDEIYDQILYDRNKHVSIASLPDMQDRTIAILGLSKTYSMTGWRVGYVAAEKSLSKGIRKVHDFLTVCAPTPLQHGCITALSLPDSYYTKLCKRYDESRLLILDALGKCGFEAYKPEGAYYVWTSIKGTGYNDDRELAEYLVSKVGVGSVPGSSFYHKPEDGRLNLRFSFSKHPSTIKTAVQRLSKFKTGIGKTRKQSSANRMLATTPITA